MAVKNGDTRKLQPVKSGTPSIPRVVAAEPAQESVTELLARRLATVAESLSELDRAVHSPDRPQRERQVALDLLALRADVPRGQPSLEDMLSELRRSADVLDEARTSKDAQRALWPFAVETLRPQHYFNAALQQVLETLFFHGKADSAWIRATLQQHMDPAHFKLRTHRRGIEGQSVLLSKRLGLFGIRRFIQSWVDAQRSWNEVVIELLANHEKLSASDINAAHLELRHFATEAAALPAQLPRAWTLILKRQQHFNAVAELMISRLLGVREWQQESDYAAWRETEEPRLIAQVHADAAGRTDPLLSVLITSEANDLPDEAWLRSVESVFLQTHPARELCVVVPSRRLKQAIEQLDAPDSCAVSVAVQPKSSLAARWNAALQAASGERLCFLEAGDALAPFALSAIANAVRQKPAAGMHFGDEDTLGPDGLRRHPFFKPSWSEDMALETDYATRPLVLQRALMKQLRGLRSEAGPAALYELSLRASKVTTVERLPYVLCHRAQRPVSPHFKDGAARAAADYLASQSKDARVQVTQTGWRVKHPARDALVSLIVPVHLDSQRLHALVRSVRRVEPGVKFELLLATCSHTHLRTFPFVASVEREDTRVAQHDGPWEFARVFNHAAENARGEILVFMSPWLEANQDGWLRELVSQVQRPEVGVVGPKLLLPDGRVDNAGIVVGPHGFAAYPFWQLRVDESRTAFGQPNTVRQYLATAGACLAVRRETFQSVGRFDPNAPAEGADVDLCLRIGARGLRVLNTPHATLVHHRPSQSTFPLPSEWWRSFRSCREALVRGDPFYNPNLTLLGPDCAPRLDRRSAVELAAQHIVWQADRTQRLIRDQKLGH